MAKRKINVARTYVLDASALIAVLFAHDDVRRIERVLPGALVSAVSYAEVVHELGLRGGDLSEMIVDLYDLDVEVVALDRLQAEATARLRGAAADDLGLEPFAAAALAQARSATLVRAEG